MTGLPSNLTKNNQTSPQKIRTNLMNNSNSNSNNSNNNNNNNNNNKVIIKF